MIVQVRTLAGPKHSGQFGGAAPDALLALLHALATLHDENGDVAVPGLRREEWTGASYSDDEFRELAEIVPGMPLLRDRRPRRADLVRAGDHRHRHRRAARRQARSTLSCRTRAPSSACASIRSEDPHEAQAALVRHLEALRPFGIALEVEAAETGKGFAASTTGPAYEAARAAFETVWGSEPSFVATGGSIPLVSALQEAAPDAEILLLGHDRRLREHPRAERARAAGRVREGGRSSRPSSSAGFAETVARQVSIDDERTRTRPPGRDPHGMMQRILGAIERGGNKMPNPAILFVWLCVIVIVLSALLAWADIKVTYQVVEPPPITVEEIVQGGSTQPSGGLPDASVQEGEYTVKEETAAIQSLLSADGIRFLFTSFVANFRNFAAVAIILVGDDRRRPRRGSRA